MKMKYHLKNKVRGNRKSNKTFFTVFFLVILLGLISILSPSTLPGRLNNLGKPVWKSREVILESFSGLRNILNSKSFLITENKKLKDELQTARETNIKINLLEKENKELKNILGRRTEAQRILARVLSKAGQSPYGTIIIDVGLNKVSKNQEVFSGDSILIGLIDEVYKKTAKVKLLSAPGTSYEVEIGEEAIPATAIGLGGGNFEIKLPRGVDIKIGDAVIAPNLSIRLLGIVDYVDAELQNSIQKILFKSPINTNQIKWVEIESQ
jgi:cell shape-determining protein MreC